MIFNDNELKRISRILRIISSTPIRVIRFNSLLNNKSYD